jgi:predicted secreted hydrolase
MSPLRRRWLQMAAALAWPIAVQAQPAVRRGRALVFPRDHGAHPDARIEWWYATGWLGTPDRPTHGFQLTFFRSRTGLAAGNKSRFAARQLLFAHDQRIARWSEDPAAALGAAQLDGGAVRLQGWTLRDSGSAWLARIPAAGFDLDLQMARRQPLLLQGDAGFSRKGPQEQQASHYYSDVQLAATGAVHVNSEGLAASSATGQAWMDHEWSDEILHPEAVGWDWIGINLFDGSALTAFVLRRADGSALWAGGSWRPPGQPARPFKPEEVQFKPGRSWSSPGSGARYPVRWQVETPAGSHTVNALMDAQELDGRGSTGSVYWEGLSELLDSAGRRVGLGYLEMTGYAGRLKLG